MKIMKFGGTSLRSADSMKLAASIVVKELSSSEPIVMVCSAMEGVTDKLIDSAALAAKGEEAAYEQIYQELHKRHRACARELGIDDFVHESLEELFVSWREVLRGVFLLGECTARSRDLIMSFGEQILCMLMSEYLRTLETSTQLIDTRQVLKTDDQFGNARLKREESYQNIRTHVTGSASVYVVTGFIASTDKGYTTTLGRGGSDYTASLFGAALGADEVQIWTDVNGVLTADPQLVKNNDSILEMTYEEAMEMSHFGAKVIYSPTMQPMLEMGIPLVVKNTFEPEHPGTRIHTQATSIGPIKGISSIASVALIRLSGPGMVGVTGTAARMFSSLARVGINVIMITQGSSEHSICVVIDPQDAKKALGTFKEEFALEILSRQIDDIALEGSLSVIAVIGERMRQVPGIGGKIFQALGDYGVNVVAIAQGSSERNISIVVHEDQVADGMQAIHDRFFRSKQPPIHIVLVGNGLVGGTLLQQIAARHMQEPEVIVCGLANSRKMLLNKNGIDPSQLESTGEPADIPRLVEWLKQTPLSHKVFVDATASEEPIAFYESLLRAGVSVVTPNKRATSSDFAAYKRLKEAARRCPFRYETNVGAGLPVISVMQSLVKAGDQIQTVEGILSGTLSYLFNTYQEGMSFTELLREAREKGYTEPDPRDDLSGMDVARKLLILAREMGLELELSDVEVENLVPEDCRHAPDVDSFFEALQGHDDAFALSLAQATSQGKKLRYVARVSDGHASVTLEAVSEDHPCFGLSGSDNLISFTTDRYCDRPLVVRGPGAGAQVTAAGVLADILSCSP
jgi:bifunctional aspartokinase / homoserine dehydrogenase 1